MVEQPFYTPAAVGVAMQVNVPFVLWSEPGTGKSKFVEAVCRAWGWHCLTRILATMMPEDIGGFGAVEGGRLKRLPDEWVYALLDADRPMLFFADEMNHAPAALQSVFHRVALERHVGPHPLPAHVRIAAACNPPECATAEGDLRPALANRFVHLEWAPPVDRFVSGMTTGWGAMTRDLREVDWTQYAAVLPQSRALVATYIQHRPTALHQMPKGSGVDHMAFPTRRSWDMAATLHAGARASGVGGEVAAELLAGCVGAGGASEFLAYERDMDLPDPEKVLAAPHKWRVPERADRVFAALGAIMAVVGERMKHEKTRSDAWERGWKVLAHVFKGQRDVAAAGCKTLVATAKDYNMSLADGACATAEIDQFVRYTQEIGLSAKKG